MTRGYTMVITDEPAELETILRALFDPAHRRDVVVAGDAAHALYAMFGNDGRGARGVSGLPELVVVDVDAPRVRELELPRLLKIDPRTEHIPVITIASEDEDDACRREDGSLACDFIVRKPCDVVMVSMAIASIEAKESWSFARAIAAPAAQIWS